jgi:hypothetical protein
MNKLRDVAIVLIASVIVNVVYYKTSDCFHLFLEFMEYRSNVHQSSGSDQHQSIEVIRMHGNSSTNEEVSYGNDFKG